MLFVFVLVSVHCKSILATKIIHHNENHPSQPKLSHQTPSCNTCTKIGNHTCRLFDEGVHVTASEFRTLPAELARLNPCYQHCQMAPASCSFEESSERIRSGIRAGDECHMLLIDAHRQPRLVRLFADADCEQELYFVLPEDAEEVVASADEMAGGGVVARPKSITGYVTSVESSASFWVQDDNVGDQLDAMAARLAEIEHDVPATVSVGELYAAKFADDGLLYRAVVLERSDEQDEASEGELF